MRNSEIEELKARVAALEKQVAELRAANEEGTREKDWRRTVGMFTGDPGMRQVFEEAMKLREADREKARRQFVREDRAKKARQLKRMAGSKK
jgi:hypothetical protein